MQTSGAGSAGSVGSWTSETSGDIIASSPCADGPDDIECFSFVDSSGDEVWTDVEHGLIDSEGEDDVGPDSDTGLGGAWTDDYFNGTLRAQDPFFDFQTMEVSVMPTDEEIEFERDVRALEVERGSVISRGESEESWIIRTMGRMKHVDVDGVSDKLPPGMELIGDGEWVRVKGGMTLDSGCSVFVMPSRWLRHLTLEPSEGSRRGQNFVAANNQPMKNEGQRTVRFRTFDGSRRQMVFQVAAVNKILASIAGICDNGNVVTFRDDGGTITHIQTKRETHFRRQGNVYVMDMWVRNPKFKGTPEKSMDFTRHGQGN